MKKRFWPSFSRFIERKKSRGRIFKSPQCILEIFVQMICSFLWDVRSPKKPTFQKLAVFTMTKVFGPLFLVLSSVTNIRDFFIESTNYSDNYSRNYKSFFLRPKRLLKTQSLQKLKARFCRWRKSFDLIFPVLSNIKNVMELKIKTIKVQKVFWRFLCKW